MRRARQGLLGCLSVLAGWIVAAPAHAITNVFALQETIAAPGGVLLQYAVGAGGALSPLAPATVGATARDIALTPDGRFGYVMTSSPVVSEAPTSTIVPFARGAGGRLQPSGAAIGPLPGSSRAILVDPQGTHVYYARPGNAILVRRINGDGTLGAESAFAVSPVAPLIAPDIQFLAMTPDGRNLYGAQYDGRTGLLVWQSTIDPATGLGTPKNPASVPFPSPAGAAGPTSVGRMAITPSAGHLYLASDTAGVGIGRWAIDPGTGALAGGTQEAPPADGHAEAAVAVAAGGATLWAPSAGSASAPERTRQFSIGAGGVLAALAPPAVDYVVASPARDLVPSPDGASLYLGQSGTVGEWSVGAGGTLGHRANVPAGPDPGLVNQGIAPAPSQAPVADFTATPAAAGRASLFDARASADPDGTIARYDWDFGDGASTANGGPSTSHTYATSGTRIVTLTVTDADGTSTAPLWTGARMLRNGGPSARTTRSVTIAAALRARPRKGRSVTVRAVSGKILVRVPRSSRYVPIEQLTEIPLGSIIDARKGKAQITAEVNARTHRTQSSIFYDWYFKILQTKGSKPITEARMTKGSFASCTPSRLSRSGFAAKAKKRSKKKVRRLWGKGKGDFRTGGKRSSATVRGTQWLVEDRCDGTLTRVKQGRVDVRDFRRKKTVRLWKRSGKRSIYLAKAP